MGRGKAAGIGILIAAFVAFLDQYVKNLVREHLAPGESLPADGGFFSLYHTNNTGVAFSMLREHPNVILWIQAALLALIAVGLGLLLRRGNVPWYYVVSLGMMLGGGAGNLIDRLARGYVTDFIKVGDSFAIFNLADAALTGGCGLLIIGLIVAERRRSREEAGAGEAGSAEAAHE
ncbi:MAG: signal peptidase II [Clostridiales Family XIII bacterium]|jgi:signal peptidase II|nr:signal peptidase II [Clostridiales Family XIII bacterium]